MRTPLRNEGFVPDDAFRPILASDGIKKGIVEPATEAGRIEPSPFESLLEASYLVTKDCPRGDPKLNLLGVFAGEFIKIGEQPDELDPPAEGTYFYSKYLNSYTLTVPPGLTPMLIFPRH